MGGYGMMRIINSPKGTELSTAIKEWSESVDALQNSRRENSRPSRSPSARTHNLDRRSSLSKPELSEIPKVELSRLIQVSEDSGYTGDLVESDSGSGSRNVRSRSRSRKRRRKKERAA